jgi:ADP-ribosylglycohydrolase
MGFIKHAIVLSFYFLLVHAKRGGNLTHFDVIKETIALAGDSDTNACITGGMAGALLGFNGLVENMVKIVL